MPSVVAVRYNPRLKLFCQRLRANGKAGRAAPRAVMRKLITRMNRAAQRVLALPPRSAS